MSGKLGDALIVVGTVAAMLVLLLALGRITPAIPEAAVELRAAVLCDTAEIGAECVGDAVALPYYEQGEAGTRRLVFPLDDLDLAPFEVGAIYLPALSDAVDILVDDVRVLASAREGGQAWHWNRPVVVTQPGPQLREAAELTILLHSGQVRPFALDPVLIGPENTLRPMWTGRWVLTAGMAGLGLVLISLTIVIGAVLSVLVWDDTIYRWALLAGISALVVTLNYAPFPLPLRAAPWLALWTTGVSALVCCLHVFTCRFLRLRRKRLERLTQAYTVLTGLVMFQLAPEQVWVGAAVFTLGTLLITTGLLVDLAWEAGKVSRFRFVTLTGSMALTAALGLHDWFFYFPDPPVAGRHMGQFMPSIFLFIVGWLVLSRLVTALGRQRTLAKLLRRRVAARSKALRASNQRLAEQEKEALLAGERQRIMLDLHDGVGGHLTNALASLRSAAEPDPLLTELLEEAQADLGLMVDSLDHRGDPVTLLAMLRARLEPTLTRRGIVFDWRIGEGPNMPKPGPQTNANLLRLVQEFVTNTLKHAAGATRITVETGPHFLILSDDGCGFDLEASRPRGHGLRSMLSRAEMLGAQPDLSAGSEGVRLMLRWPDIPAPHAAQPKRE